MTDRLDAALISAALARQRASWLPDLFPAGKVEGGIFYIGDADGSAGRSMPIPLKGNGHAHIVDFGGSFRGDDLDLFARGRGLELREAIPAAAEYLGMAHEPPRREHEQRPARKPPEEAVERPATAARATPTATWTYTDAKGTPLVTVARYDPEGERKLFRQYNNVEKLWTGKGGGTIPEPRPLYNLVDLTARPDEQVVFVAGEKCADALIEVGLLGTTNLGGENSLNKCDLQPLKGRSVCIWRDNDDSGKVWEKALLSALTKLGCRLTVVQPPPEAPEKWDVADALIDGQTDIRAVVQGSMRPPGGLTIEVSSWTGYHLRTPPMRRFVADQWIPHDCVTSLYGPGGVGKSLLAQQLATAIALGQAWLGAKTDRCRVLAIFCEDDEEELWRRQDKINASMGITMLDLALFIWQPRVGSENRLVWIEGSKLAIGPFMEWLRTMLRRHRPECLILDNIAQLFAGNENDRAHVTGFINMLSGVVQEFSCALVLLGHIGKGDGSEYSGSTAWDAAVRSRLLLQRVIADDGSRSLKLSRPKSNYAVDETINLEWRNGVLVPTDPKFRTAADVLDDKCRQSEVDQIFLNALDTLTEQGRAVSDVSTTRSYGPRIMASEDMGKDATLRELEGAMKRLFAAGRILANQPIGPGKDRHGRYGIVRR